MLGIDAQFCIFMQISAKTEHKIENKGAINYASEFL